MRYGVEQGWFSALSSWALVAQPHWELESWREGITPCPWVTKAPGISNPTGKDTQGLHRVIDRARVVKIIWTNTNRVMASNWAGAQAISSQYPERGQNHTGLFHSWVEVTKIKILRLAGTLRLGMEGSHTPRSTGQASDGVKCEPENQAGRVRE